MNLQSIHQIQEKSQKIIKNKSKVQNNSNMLIQAEKNKGFRKQK